MIDNSQTKNIEVAIEAFRTIKKAVQEYGFCPRELKTMPLDEEDMDNPALRQRLRNNFDEYANIYVAIYNRVLPALIESIRNIESEYNALRAENEQLVYKAMLADELQQTLSQYEDLTDEINANINMHPVVATVIGRSDSNYFSTFTINKGTADGIEDYMAVTISGALVGYTENTQENKSTVRTVIDSNASIAAIIQSSRDLGTVRGTLGVDGTPMCRMYYLPEDNLPRPGDLVVTSGVGLSFPKGIPIGVVRESTRGMDSNKQYIILEPKVDFQHLEYVIVLLYKPKAGAIQGRENGKTEIPLVPLESARPSPEIPQIAASLFDSPTPAGAAHMLRDQDVTKINTMKPLLMKPLLRPPNLLYPLLRHPLRPKSPVRKKQFSNTRL